MVKPTRFSQYCSVGCPFRGIVDIGGIRTRDWMETCRIGTYVRDKDMGCQAKDGVHPQIVRCRQPSFSAGYIHSQNEMLI